MSLECFAKYPGVGQRGFKHDTAAAYNLIDVRASDTKLFRALLADSIDGSAWQAVQTTCNFGFKGASGIYHAKVALDIGAFHGLHGPGGMPEQTHRAMAPPAHTGPGLGRCPPSS